MAKLTIRKSSRPLKCKSSPPTRSVPSSTIRRTNQRVKNAGFVNPDDTGTVHDLDADENGDGLHTPSAAVKDVSGETFTLTRRFMLGSNAIVEDTNFPTLRKCLFRHFETIAVQKLNKSVNDPEIKFE